MQDDELKNLVLTPSQSASSGSAGVFNSLSGLLTPTIKTTRLLSGARAPLLEERTGAGAGGRGGEERRAGGGRAGGGKHGWSATARNGEERRSVSVVTMLVGTVCESMATASDAVHAG